MSYWKTRTSRRRRWRRAILCGLEAGLCLYGHDIDETTTPIEAGLAWTIGKRRRAEGGFPGADKILGQLAPNKPPKRRVGLRITGAPAREGSKIFSPAGDQIGVVTSGTFAPVLIILIFQISQNVVIISKNNKILYRDFLWIFRSLSRPISMGYVTTDFSKAGTPVQVLIFVLEKNIFFQRIKILFLLKQIFVFAKLRLRWGGRKMRRRSRKCHFCPSNITKSPPENFRF